MTILDKPASLGYTEFACKTNPAYKGTMMSILKSRILPSIFQYAFLFDWSEKNYCMKLKGTQYLAAHKFFRTKDLWVRHEIFSWITRILEKLAIFNNMVWFLIWQYFFFWKWDGSLLERSFSILAIIFYSKFAFYKACPRRGNLVNGSRCKKLQDLF